MFFIGKNIKKIRKERRITQLELAEKLGITQAALSRYEKCLTNPSLDIFINLCKVLNCDSQSLLEDYLS